jgi:hypothetical protein
VVAFPPEELAAITLLLDRKLISANTNGFIKHGKSERLRANIVL